MVAEAQPYFFTIAESVALIASCGEAKADTASAMALIGASPVMPAAIDGFAVRSVRSPPSVSALCAIVPLRSETLIVSPPGPRASAPEAYAAPLVAG